MGWAGASWSGLGLLLGPKMLSGAKIIKNNPNQLQNRWFAMTLLQKHARTALELFGAIPRPQKQKNVAEPPEVMSEYSSKNCKLFCQKNYLFVSQLVLLHGSCRCEAAPA